MCYSLKSFPDKTFAVDGDVILTHFFSDNNVSTAESYCRNPAGARSKLWCYTMDPDVEWEYCDISVCQGK